MTLGQEQATRVMQQMARSPASESRGRHGGMCGSWYHFQILLSRRDHNVPGERLRGGRFSSRVMGDLVKGMRALRGGDYSGSDGVLGDGSGGAPPPLRAPRTLREPLGQRTTHEEILPATVKTTGRQGAPPR